MGCLCVCGGLQRGLAMCWLRVHGLAAQMLEASRLQFRVVWVRWRRVGAGEQRIHDLFASVISLLGRRDVHVECFPSSSASLTRLRDLASSAISGFTYLLSFRLRLNNLQSSS